jgi:hypothetical protein
MKHKSTIILSVFTLVFAFVSIGIFAWWRFYPYKIVEYFDLPYIIDVPVLQAGDTLTYHFKYCKHTDLTPKIQRDYVDGIIFKSSNTFSLAKKGCGTVYINEKVPETLPGGYYYLQVTIEYQVNPIRKITYINRTQQFQVITKESSER